MDFSTTNQGSVPSSPNVLDTSEGNYHPALTLPMGMASMNDDKQFNVMPQALMLQMGMVQNQSQGYMMPMMAQNMVQMPQQQASNTGGDGNMSIVWMPVQWNCQSQQPMMQSFPNQNSCQDQSNGQDTLMQQPIFKQGTGMQLPQQQNAGIQLPTQQQQEQQQQQQQQQQLQFQIPQQQQLQQQQRQGQEWGTATTMAQQQSQQQQSQQQQSHSSNNNVDWTTAATTTLTGRQQQLPQQQSQQQQSQQQQQPTSEPELLNLLQHQQAHQMRQLLGLLEQQKQATTVPQCQSKGMELPQRQQQLEMPLMMNQFLANSANQTNDVASSSAQLPQGPGAVQQQAHEECNQKSNGYGPQDNGLNIQNQFQTLVNKICTSSENWPSSGNQQQQPLQQQPVQQRQQQPLQQQLQQSQQQLQQLQTQISQQQNSQQNLKMSIHNRLHQQMSNLRQNIQQVQNAQSHNSRMAFLMEQQRQLIELLQETATDKANNNTKGGKSSSSMVQAQRSGKGFGSTYGPNIRNGTGAASDGIPLVSNDYPAELTNTAVADTMKSQLQALQMEDSGRIFIARRINKLGFGSGALLREFFSQYGRVKAVYVSHSRVKKTTLRASKKVPAPESSWRLRAAALGFVVMADAEAATNILLDGPEHNIHGVHVKVSEFLRLSQNQMLEENEDLIDEEKNQGKDFGEDEPEAEYMTDEYCEGDGSIGA